MVGYIKRNDVTALLEFFDWTNPDPQVESYDGTVALSDALALVPEQNVWNVLRGLHSG